MARPRTTAEQKKEKARLRKQKSRQNQKAKRELRTILGDAMHGLMHGSFQEHLRENYQGSIIEQGLHAGGVVFLGDLEGGDHTGVYPEDEMWEEDFGVPLNSLNRAVVMIEGMLDATRELARIVNQFKMQEIDRSILEAEGAGVSNAELERLHRVKTRLRRSVQVRLPVYSVGGEYLIDAQRGDDQSSQR